MNPYPVLTKTLLLLCIAFAIVYTFVIGVVHFFFFSPSLIMCDVGQGDAFLLQLDSSMDILIDAGPDSSVVHCLNNHIPFFDRQIELVIITHPDFDHFGGMKSVLRSYTVHTILAPAVGRDTAAFVEFSGLVKEKKIQYQSLQSGDILSFSSGEMHVFWPPHSFIEKNTVPTETGYKKPLLEANDYSLVFVFSLHGEKILFTGDIHEKLLTGIVDDIGDISVLKIPHHGAKNGLNNQILSVLQPEKALISSGEKNRYGHPHSAVIELLKNHRVDLIRTDHGGEFIMKIP